jgi:hypothetical protein
MVRSSRAGFELFWACGLAPGVDPQQARSCGMFEDGSWRWMDVWAIS